MYLPLFGRSSPLLLLLRIHAGDQDGEGWGGGGGGGWRGQGSGEGAGQGGGAKERGGAGRGGAGGAAATLNAHLSSLSCLPTRKHICHAIVHEIYVHEVHICRHFRVYDLRAETGPAGALQPAGVKDGDVVAVGGRGGGGVAVAVVLRDEWVMLVCPVRGAREGDGEDEAVPLCRLLDEEAPALFLAVDDGNVLALPKSSECNADWGGYVHFFLSVVDKEGFLLLAHDDDAKLAIGIVRDELLKGVAHEAPQIASSLESYLGFR